MELTRRGFLKAGAIGTTVALGFDVSTARAEMRQHDGRALPLLDEIQLRHEAALYVSQCRQSREE